MARNYYKAETIACGAESELIAQSSKLIAKIFTGGADGGRIED
jgi:hypothetical protein